MVALGVHPSFSAVASESPGGTNGCVTLANHRTAEVRAGGVLMPKLIRCVPLVVALSCLSVALNAQAKRDTSTMMNDAWITTQIHAKFFAGSRHQGPQHQRRHDPGVVTLQGKSKAARRTIRRLQKRRRPTA